jgi:hypothetical protein
MVAATAPGQPPDAVWVLRALARLGYQGIAQAPGQARQQTGLQPGELAALLGLAPAALLLWEQGLFLPKLCHLLRLGDLLDQHDQAQPPPTPPTCRPPTPTRSTTR